MFTIFVVVNPRGLELEVDSDNVHVASESESEQWLRLAENLELPIKHYQELEDTIVK